MGWIIPRDLAFVKVGEHVQVAFPGKGADPHQPDWRPARVIGKPSDRKLVIETRSGGRMEITDPRSIRVSR